VQNKVIVIAGATATGKTAMAEKIALDQNGELISADSRQNYKYLDIGTNKGFLEAAGLMDQANLPVFKTASGVLIHQINFLDLDQAYNAASFQQNTADIIKQILESGKTPIIVGGTGLYIQSVLEAERYNFVDSQPSGEFNDLSLVELQKTLSQDYPKDWQYLGNDRKQNPAHLRGLLRQLKRQGLDIVTNPTIEFLKGLDFKLIYTQHEQEKHRHILQNRVSEMWKAGLIDEVKQVLALGVDQDAVALKTIGYPEMIQYINGEITEAAAQSLIMHAHWQYARKQIKWFKKYFVPLLGA